ncbi:unnamed protein product [Ceratitis capitata]|uniref:(Mediterranean fruit fly) hypothetical protein n=1 Tax=Ceratitis capitata TaxID=7213 RepID=A0A811V3T5_CERCA|nr:unnamed protein product [Ceratitis capitata]
MPSICLGSLESRSIFLFSWSSKRRMHASAFVVVVAVKHATIRPNTRNKKITIILLIPSLSLSLFVSAIYTYVWDCVCMCKQAEEKCKVNKTELEEKGIYGSAELGSSLCDEAEVFL